MSDTATATPGAIVREAVGVFHHWSNLQGAVDELLAHGFDRAEISLLAGEKAVEDKLGHIYAKVAELEDAADAPRAAFVGRDSITEAKAFAISGLGYVGAVAAIGAVVASGGTLAAVIGAAVAAGLGGAGLGTLLSRAMGREQAHDLETQLNKGGLLLWVRTRDAAHEARAIEVLKKHHGDDVHVHDLAASAEPEDDPMTGFEPDPFLPKARV